MPVINTALPTPTKPFVHTPTSDGIPRLIRIALESPTDGLETLFTMQMGFDAIIVSPSTPVLPEVDMVCFSGGADIDPKLYGQKKLPKTFTSEKRDEFSMRLHKQYATLPKIGVCRGAQLLCALNGGSLWQEIPWHNNGQHYINTTDGTHRSIMVTSVHHQACRPSQLMHIHAYSAKKVHHAEDDKMVDHSGVSIVEAFFIPEDNALCVQFHPEYGMRSCEDYFWELFGLHFGHMFNLQQKKKTG